MALAHLKDHGALKSDAIELDAVGSDQNGIDSPSGKKNSDYDDRQHMHRLGKAQLFDVRSIHSLQSILLIVVVSGRFDFCRFSLSVL